MTFGGSALKPLPSLRFIIRRIEAKLMKCADHELSIYMPLFRGFCPPTQNYTEVFVRVENSVMTMTMLIANKAISILSLGITHLGRL